MPLAWLPGQRCVRVSEAMEEATISGPAAARSPRPPRSRLPAIVQMFRLARDPLHFVARAQRRYGDIFVLSLPFFGRTAYVADPALVKEVFTGSPAQFHAGEANTTFLEPSFGPNSVLTLDDEPHMRQRKLLLPPFHGERIRRYGELTREITLRDMETWPVGTPFALHHHTQRITLAVIMRAVFGVHDEQRLLRFEQLIKGFEGRITAVTALPALRRDLGRWSPWNRFLRAREALDEFIYEEIALRRSVMERDETERDDVLSLLLQARHDDGSPMGDEELRDELITVLGAGHETTAAELAWALERLLRTPRALRKLRESIAAGGDDYLDATIKETLRTRPVIGDVLRKLTGPARIGGYELAAGTVILTSIAAMHKREDLFPNPEEFRPERFLDGKADTYVWIPFGGGVRRCIGAAFAEYEMRVVLRTILERAELSAPDPKPERVKIHNVALVPAKGTRVVLDRPLQQVA
jgi:cytochrome P450